MASPFKRSSSSSTDNHGSIELRRGPWTDQEDSLLIQYIDSHGEGRWNLLAKCSGLRRTGKSCRLRWLNYLKPDVKRGNLSPEEQLLILQLHSQLGNRWSKIAQFLPGRTDNEIKNYWRTRVQRQAKNLNTDSNTAAFHNFWMPRLTQETQVADVSPGCYQSLLNSELEKSSNPGFNSPESMKFGHHFDVVSEWHETDDPEFGSCLEDYYQFDNALDTFSPSSFLETAEFKEVVDDDDQLGRGGGGNSLMDGFLDDSLWNMDTF